MYVKYRKLILMYDGEIQSLVKLPVVLRAMEVRASGLKIIDSCSQQPSEARPKIEELN